MRITILGCGYSGTAIAQQCLVTDGLADVTGTRRAPSGLESLHAANIPALRFDGPPGEQLLGRLEHTTHLISSVAPARVPPLDDPALTLVHRLALAGRLPRLRWIGYLSTIGVYGDHRADWVDEQTPCGSAQARSIMRTEAERQWQDMADAFGVACCVLRLSGIYGPDRNVLEDVRAGRARRVIKPGHVFNRVHVEDIARFTVAALQRGTAGVYNVTDDEPAPSATVVEFACQLLDTEPPEPVPFDAASMSAMALSFWAECKRVSNRLGKQTLDFTYRYPSYREGLGALRATWHD